MAEKLARRQSHRLHGLSHDSPPTMEGQEGVTMEQPTSANVLVGTTLASEIREEFTCFTNPLVQIPPAADVFVHSPLEGHVDCLPPPYYGPDTPFLRNSMAKIFLNLGLLGLHQKILL